MERPGKSPDDTDSPRGEAAESDGALVRAALAGDRKAFDQLVRKYQRQAVSLAYQRLGNSDDAQEVAQDAFIKAYSQLQTLQQPGAFGGWLMRTVSNLALNFRRGRRLRRNPGLDEAVASGDSNPPEGGIQSDHSYHTARPSRSLEDAELAERTRAAMDQLPEKQRLAIEMFAINKMPQKDVAQALGCSVEAVKWHVFQGRKKLKDLLADLL
jgi:RNA polymerase sigma-70 factor, ECF subfamily